MSTHGPRIILPGGYQVESGLYLPTQFLPMQVPADVPPEFRPEAGLIVVARPPSFMDQIRVFATQEELGLEPTRRDVLLETIREIPF